ncbi:MAG: ABC transporter permease subunit, partial [Clostridia bacterium]|nr:ABC transporter permease subunit [Clostridia bacterium]
DPINGYTDTYIHTLKGAEYSTIYSYQLVERLNSTEFLINNNANYTDYASMYNTAVASTPEPNAFDFVYTGMELCSFVIIIFCVVIGASMVAGEQNNGTLKLLAIRPFKRHKILTSKILSTLLFGIILSLFCMIILFILGWINYGVDMTPVLAIFDATLPFAISPILAMLIYLACLIFKILAYVLIAVAISVLFRSNVGAVSISIFIFFFSTLFGYMFIDSVWYAYLPFSNFDLFKYFGGNFVANTSASTLSSTGILYNTSFYFSLIISVVCMIILTILSYKVFKSREIK